MAFTLVVVLGTGDSVATTPPPCAFRPESGSEVGRVLGGGGVPTWAKPQMANTRIEAATPRRRATETFEVNFLIFFCLCLSLVIELFVRLIAWVFR
jgi:hypothetical protein